MTMDQQDLILGELRAMRQQISALTDQVSGMQPAQRGGDTKWAAKRIGISTYTVQKLARQGAIAHTRPNGHDLYFTAEAVDAYLGRGARGTIEDEVRSAMRGGRKRQPRA